MPPEYWPTRFLGSTSWRPTVAEETLGRRPGRGRVGQEQPGLQDEHLPGGHQRVEPHLLQRHADALAHLALVLRHVEARYPGRAAVGRGSW